MTITNLVPCTWCEAGELPEHLTDVHGDQLCSDCVFTFQQEADR